ncbi:MAG: hypothetical protein JXN60_07925 [Lentisphaerae bacterium]|nr:hypothetical protein [Lentisphaerota bacterium]
MNLRADLILEEEQRSASVINLKSLIRIATILVPLCIVIIVAMAIVGLISISGRVTTLNSEWEALKPKKEIALRLKTDVNINLDILKEIENWQTTRINSYELLLEVMKAVRPKIVLSNLNLTQQLINKTDTGIGRYTTLSLKGTAYTSSAQDDVNAVKEYFSAVSTNEPKISDVAIPLYEQDKSKEAEKTDRVFEVRVEYAPGIFK